MPSNGLVRGLRNQLVDMLREDVLSGRYKVGEAIRQQEVVARYRVSRTPVREALIQLEQEGLVVLSPNCGARVAEQAPDALHDLLIPMRRVLELFALRKGFAKLSDAQFARWYELLQRMREACKNRDHGALASEDIAFHRSIIELAEEPALLKIWSTLVTQVRSHFLQSYAQDEDLMKIYREHAEIVEVFRRGDLAESVRHLGQRIGEPDGGKVITDLLRMPETESGAE